MDFLTTLLGIFSGGGLGGGEDLLPGKVFTPIAAAFATQGYFAHAEILDLLAATSFQHYAVFVYMCAIIMALCGMALGSPPKFYLWFIMGPVVFHFLIGTTQDVYGNAWAVAGEPQEQNEVWKLVEAGMTGSPFLTRSGVRVTANGGPSSPVAVSWFFAKLDGLISDTVQELTKWLGVYTKGGSDGTATADSNITKAPTEEKIKWYLLSNLKWGFLDTITSAKLASSELRVAFNTFLAGSCGDAFYASIDDGKYGAAARSTDGSIPRGVFRTVDASSSGAAYTTAPATTYKFLDENLKKISVGVPLSLRKLLLKGTSSTSTGSGSGTGTTASGSMWRFRDALPDRLKTGLGDEAPVQNFGGDFNYGAGTIEALMAGQVIKCNRFLDIIMQGFRWEAAQVYGSLMLNSPSGLGKPEVLDYVMLHGWDVRIKEDPWKAPTANEIGGFKNEGEPLDTVAKRREYLVGLILVNMLKNEFLIAPNPHRDRMQSSATSSQAASAAVETYQKTVGQRSKFGEIYTWAKMMPYLQGVLLYILAIGYPFACIFVLIPGWHKIIFTWSSFWIWAKIWDLGFAIVVVLERSIWATIGNSAKASKMNPFIAQMFNWGETQVLNWTVIPIPPFGFAPVPLQPEAWKIHIIEKAVNGAADMPNVLSYMYLDRAMTLFNNMDLDLQNSYYIYIMAALYFAVPAVTGQLVLGAKAGVAGLVTGAFTQMSQETGAKAGAVLTAENQQRYAQAQAAATQAFRAKELSDFSTPFSTGTLMKKVMEGEFDQAMGQFNASTQKQWQEGLQAKGQMLKGVHDRNAQALSYGMAVTGMVSSGIASGSANFASALNGALAPYYTSQMAKRFATWTGSLTPEERMALENSGTLLEMMKGDFVSGGGGAAAMKGPQGVGDAKGTDRASNENHPSKSNIGAGSVSAMTANSGSGGGVIGAGAGDVSSAAGKVGDLLKDGGRIAIAGMRGMMTGGLPGLSDMATQTFTTQMGWALSDTMRDINAQSSQMGINAWQQGREAERNQINIGRYKPYAQGSLQDGMFFSQASYNMGIAPSLAAMGVSVQGPGQLADDNTYLLMSGNYAHTTDANGNSNNPFSTSTSYWDPTAQNADGTLGNMVTSNVDLLRFADKDQNGKGFLANQINGYTSHFNNWFGQGALNNLYNDNVLSPMAATNVAYTRTGMLFEAAKDAFGATFNPGNFLKGFFGAMGDPSKTPAFFGSNVGNPPPGPVMIETKGNPRTGNVSK